MAMAVICNNGNLRSGSSRNWQTAITFPFKGYEHKSVIMFVGKSGNKKYTNNPVIQNQHNRRNA